MFHYANRYDANVDTKSSTPQLMHDLLKLDIAVIAGLASLLAAISAAYLTFIRPRPAPGPKLYVIGTLVIVVALACGAWCLRYWLLNHQRIEARYRAIHLYVNGRALPNAIGFTDAVPDINAIRRSQLRLSES